MVMRKLLKKESAEHMKEREETGRREYIEVIYNKMVRIMSLQLYKKILDEALEGIFDFEECNIMFQRYTSMCQRLYLSEKELTQLIERYLTRKEYDGYIKSKDQIVIYSKENIDFAKSMFNYE